MLKITYDPTNNDVAVSDGGINAVVTSTLAYFKLMQDLHGIKQDYHVTVSNELVIEAFRVAIVEKRINHEHVCFIFNNEELYPNSVGCLPKWPKGFCNTHSTFLRKLA